MILTVLLRFVIICCCLCGVSPIFADTRPHSIKVVMDNNYPPFVFQDNNGNIQGILIDQWKLWERKTGIKANISAMDWGQAISRMKSGEFDVIDTVFQTEERSGWLDFTKPYEKIEVPIFFDKEISGITDAASLKGFVVATKTGDAAIDLLKRNGVENLMLFNNYEAVIQAAREHKITVFVADSPPALYFLHKFGIQKQYKMSDPLQVGHFHRAVKKGNVELLKTVEDGFGLISPAELKKIDKKWYGSPLENHISVESILAGSGALCLLLISLLFWNHTLRKAVTKRTAELKKTEESLHLTSFAVKNAADTVIWIADDASIIEGNEAACRLLGYTRDELLKLNVADISTFDTNVWPKHWEELKAHGSLFFESNQRAKDGKLIPVEITANFIRFNDREYNCAFIRDISKRRKAEVALRDSEEQMRIIFETTESGIIMVNPHGVIEFSNRRMAEMFGMSHDELIGTAYPDHLHESEKMTGDKRMRQLILGEIRSIATERRYIRKDGTDFWGYLSGRRLENPDGSLRVLVGFITDITERKQMIRQLAENELRLRTLVQTIPDLIWLKDIDGVYLLCNAMFESFFGAREADIVGKTDYDFVSKELADFFREHDRKAMAAGVPTSNEEWITFASDGHHALLDTIKTPMYDSEGKLVGVLGIARDITDRKNSEEERLTLERQLLHAQKLESLGVLSGGIAHDFNNLLLAILGNLDLALMKLPEEAPARKNIERAISASRHAAKLTNMMLAYSGKGNFIIQELSLTELLEENASMLSATTSKSIKIVLQLDHALPLVMADAGQIQQVVMNLITNASEAIGDVSGLITLSTGVQWFDQVILDGSRLEEKITAGRYVWMEVRDTGCGMNEDTLHKLFDPFFTTKFTGRGLGMSAVLGIIRAHKGAFLVESQPAVGTTIRVLLPISDIPLVEQVATPVAATEAVIAATCADTILIVDDEEMIREVFVDLIKELGFGVLLAADGKEALRIFREQADRICLVLLDQVMPDMDGVVVFRELRRIQPEIKVLLVSGYSEQEISGRYKKLGLEPDGFIQKPFTLSILADEVRRVLGDAG
ncbi:MAG: PAS domain S-box protein [Pedobacter sp.]